jgi:tRNA A37 threonylcarbamoyladenosine synthetase subunit TsaC/SUA5/YrdC
MTGSAAIAITNVANAITSHTRRGAAKSATTVPPQQLSTPLVTELGRPVSSTSLHQPRSLLAMTNERALNDNRQSLFDVVDKSTAMKNN